MKPFDVVRSTVVVVDFGKITLEPGTHGIVCPNGFSDAFPLIHWANGYTCNSALGDFRVVPESRVARIVGHAVHHGKCAYCEPHYRKNRSIK